MTIQHIVLSGGGSTMGFVTFGIVKEAIDRGMLKLADLKSLYSTSAGSIVGPLFCLGVELSEIEEWLIHKPWQQLFEIDPEMLLDGYESGGWLNRGVVGELYDNLLLSADLDTEITLKGPYERNGVDIHLFCTELTATECRKCDMSHASHPDLSLKDAIYRSACIPVIFRPLTDGGSVYLDGGICNNFPFDSWRSGYPNVSLDDVMGVRYILNKDSTDEYNTADVRIPILLMRLLRNLLACINKKHPDEKEVKYMCDVTQEVVRHTDFFSVLADKSMREKLIREDALRIVSPVIETFLTENPSVRLGQTA